MLNLIVIYCNNKEIVGIKKENLVKVHIKL